MQLPLVSVVIPTRNRGPELQKTLAALKAQTYSSLEVMVIDDASDEDLESLIRSAWPGAISWRKAVNVGQCSCRNEAFQRARGKYLLSLDDDANFTDPEDLRKAVEMMENDPTLGVLTFFTCHGPEMPATISLLDRTLKYTHTFLGAAALLRGTTIEQIGGFCEFFASEGEEEELSVRVLNAGFAILFCPSILVHHRVSPLSRNNARTWERGLRNKLWLIAMHMPLRRIPVEAGWKVGGALWDAVRLGRLRRFIHGLWNCVAGLPQALHRRRPISDLALRRYDSIRFRGMCTAEEYVKPTPCGVADLGKWLRSSWWNRRRLRSVWDNRNGGVGQDSRGAFLATDVPDAPAVSSTRERVS